MHFLTPRERERECRRRRGGGEKAQKERWREGRGDGDGEGGREGGRQWTGHRHLLNAADGQGWRKKHERPMN